MEAPLVFHQLILGFGSLFAIEAAASMRFGCDHQTAGKHPLIRQFVVREHDRRDPGLDHQMQRHPATGKDGDAIAGANSPDGLAVPGTGKSRSGFQFVFGVLLGAAQGRAASRHS